MPVTPSVPYVHGTKFIGLFMHLCVGDILAGRVQLDDLELLIANTKFPGNDSLFIGTAIFLYGQMVW